MSYMKTVTLRAFKHYSRYQRMARDGQPVLVTHRGRPYFRALPPEKPGKFLGAARGGQRHFKVYLRHRTDLAEVKQALDRSFFGAGDKISYLRSDICRAELNLEIEATVLGARLE